VIVDLARGAVGVGGEPAVCAGWGDALVGVCAASQGVLGRAGAEALRSD
jgi:hypothetical protein